VDAPGENHDGKSGQLAEKQLSAVTADRGGDEARQLTIGESAFEGGALETIRPPAAEDDAEGRFEIGPLADDGGSVDGLIGRLQNWEFRFEIWNRWDVGWPVRRTLCNCPTTRSAATRAI
jgi:hypothetical protein